ncbi:MAG: glycoside hydrolase family 88 protein, partial [Campylobacterales bacterium]|nr:glycoside hydrolase family 88 protein [Campylobacterales bacterium]
IDTWCELEDEYFKYELEEIIKRYAKSIMNYQQENGSWNWIVTLKESRADSSATATLAWFLSKASEINILNEECLQASYKALQYLMSVTRRNGSVDFSQGDTKGIGVYSQLFDVMPFAQGFCIRSVNHLLNLQMKEFKRENRISEGVI